MIDRLIDLMLWDGVAILAFGGIIALGIRFYHARVGLLVAGCIPLANFIFWAIEATKTTTLNELLAIQPFLSPTTMLIMLVLVVLLFIPMTVGDFG